MLAEFEPIAHDRYEYGFARTNDTETYQYNAYYMLETYNYCKSCPKDSSNYPEWKTAEYYSYWDAILALVLVFLLFRTAVVASLVIQDTQFFTIAGDTRNAGLDSKRDQTIVAR